MQVQLQELLPPVLVRTGEQVLELPQLLMIQRGFQDGHRAYYHAHDARVHDAYLYSNAQVNQQACTCAQPRELQLLPQGWLV